MIIFIHFKIQLIFMDTEIAKLEYDVGKCESFNLVCFQFLRKITILAVNEIAKMLELKYRDFVPDFLTLVDSQEKVKSTLLSANGRISKIEISLKSVNDDIKSMVLDIGLSGLN